jgi:hypothetical protein
MKTREQPGCLSPKDTKGTKDSKRTDRGFEEVLYVLLQVTSVHILGMFTFVIESGVRSACVRKPCRSRSDLKPMWTARESGWCS